MCFAYEMGLSSGHRSGRLLSMSRYFVIIACHAISPKCRTVFWCDSAPSQGVPLGRPTRRQAVVGLRYVSPQPAVNVMAEMWRPAC